MNIILSYFNIRLLIEYMNNPIVIITFICTFFTMIFLDILYCGAMFVIIYTNWDCLNIRLYDYSNVSFFINILEESSSEEYSSDEYFNVNMSHF